ncbi:MAG: TRAP transporter substrate-binding protein [Deltaproteobacteria bacterium]|nr:TRAP transporter substrate-binding protein [Deltaproteobacteria bacterium]
MKRSLSPRSARLGPLTRCTIAVTSLLVASAARAGDEDEKDKIIIKVATVAPEGTPWSELMDGVKNRIKKDSGDKVKMKLYFGGRLGGEKETAREAREGRVQMWGGSTAAMATIVPELYALEAPFLFDSSEEADFVLDNYVRAPAEKLLAQRGFVFFQWAENGWHGIALKGECLTNVASLKGKKIRSQEATIHLDTLKALGANPVEMAVPEVLPALTQGVVDGFSNTPLFTFAVSWYQGINSYTVTDHVYQPAIIAYSKKWFDKQPADVQKILLSNAREDEKKGRAGVRTLRDPLLENFKKAKITVCTVTPELRAELKQATAPIFEQYRKKAGKGGKPIYDAVLEGKKAWAAQKK